MSVSPPSVTWVGGFLEGSEAFVDFGGGDSLGEFGCGDFGGLLAEGQELGAFSGI